MDLKKIGAFIYERRKAKNLTQKDIAEKLFITDRAVSKWECGNGLPDVSLMLPLCDILEISINELLNGATLTAQEKEATAKKQLILLLKERQDNKKKIWITITIALIGLCVLMASIILSAYVLNDLIVKILTISFGSLVMIVCIALTIAMEQFSGYYECPHCKKTFIPPYKTYFKSMTTFTKRKMTCPHCGKYDWCKRKLNK